ncbi:Protein CBG26145 [Caenorhabditis briggsae]|uniref:Protein CBG26145 n=1 Tax=Caenorhabditis briggsae TaxID=6238 RepID=B6II49_CAEBR|nr:Protein CBG26145 [Caenorhabditis briggsae]CAR99579.1 Protein CBG26145 [Caenorhabditis briggsae]
MNAYEMQFHILGRILMTRDDDMITKTIEQLLNKGYPSVGILDKCNIPFLISYYAPENVFAQRLLNIHHMAKSIQMKKELSSVLESFEAGMAQRFEGEIIPDEFVNLLALMTQSKEEVIARLAFRTLHDFPIPLAIAAWLRLLAILSMPRLPEAESLRLKMERNLNRIDEVDDGIDMRIPEENVPQVVQFVPQVPEDSDDDEESESESDTDTESEADSESDESFLSQDSAFGGIDEVLEDIREYEEEMIAFDYSLGEMITRIVIEALQSKTDGLILEYFDSESKVDGKISDVMLAVLMTYITEEDDDYASDVAAFLLQKSVTLCQFRNQNVYDYLDMIIEKSEEVYELMDKIEDMMDEEE